MKGFLREVLHTALIVFGILCAGMGLKGFLMSSRFIDGGVTGISMLLSDIFGFPLSVLIALIQVTSLVEAIDSGAFIVIHHLADVSGGTVKKRILH